MNNLQKYLWFEREALEDLLAEEEHFAEEACFE